MKKTNVLLYLLCLSFFAEAQYIIQATTPTYLTSRVPAYAQVTSYNTVTINYTPTVPPPPVTPIDDDTTHMFDDVDNFGDVLTTAYSIANGNVTTTSLGKVWTLKISIPNALNVGIHFSPLGLAPGAEMYIFTPDLSVLVDSVVRPLFTDTTTVAIPSLSSNSVIIYILERGNTGAIKSTIGINQVVAGYEAIPPFGSNGEIAKGVMPIAAVNSVSPFGILGASVDCDPSIQCQPIKIPDGRCVARLVANGKGCTGTLINNERLDGRPYFLTALHCIDKNNDGFIDVNEINGLNFASLVFQYWRAACTGNPTTSINFSGLTLRTYSRQSDFALLEMQEAPGIGDGVNYAGWNRVDNPINNGPYILHHPQQKDMRITTPSRVVSWFWNGNYWSARYSSGTVDHGSSGAPLFNEFDEVAGQLSSGWSNCNFTAFGDRYGKLGMAWNSGVSNFIAPIQNLTRQSILVTTPLSITGPSTISCGSSVQFSVPNFFNCTFTWTAGPNLTITSGANTSRITVTATAGNLSSNVQLHIHSASGHNRDVNLNLPLTLSTNGPVAAAITNVNVAPVPNTQIDVTSSIPGGSTATSYKFYVDNIVVKSGTGLPTNVVTLNGGGCGSHNVYLQLINNCGSSNSNKWFYTRTCAAFVISPNPATDFINIRSVNTAPQTDVAVNSVQNSTAGNSEIAKIKTVTIYNTTAKIIRQQAYPSGVDEAKINIAGLATGTYWVKVNDGTSQETHTIFIYGK